MVHIFNMILTLFYPLYKYKTIGFPMGIDESVQGDRGEALKFKVRNLKLTPKYHILRKISVVYRCMEND